MTSRNIVFSIVFFIALLVVAANAAPFFVDSERPITPSMSSDADKSLEVWCQVPANTAAIESQVSDNPPEVVVQIDDFTAATNEAITMIRWWGYVAAGTGPVDHFIIAFYQSGGCTGPDGEAFSQRTVTNWTEVVYDEVLMEYSAAIDPVLMDAGATYWISIVGAMDIDPGGYWLWGSGTPILCPAMARAPTYGITDWVPVYPMIFDVPELQARAFCLGTDGVVPTEKSTWGNLKSLFR